MKITDKEIFFEPELQKQIKDKFYLVDEDQQGKKRLFFENSGGSLRLKAAVEAKAKYEMIPDCPERAHDTSMMLKKVKADGIKDIMQIIFGAQEGEGALVTELTSSQVMFQIVRTIMENAAGTNVVTTSLEHPSAFDAVEYYAKKTGKEFRVAMGNPNTGGVDVEEILSKIDKNTGMLSVMSASNLTGYIFDIKEITKEARKINPDIYVVTDGVQHMPHGVLDVCDWEVDACTFAPYKAFGIRGCGFGYVSERVAKMDHHKLLAKPEKEWELGTFPHPNYAAISAVVDYVCWLGGHFNESTDRRQLFCSGMERIHLQEHSLLLHMLNGTDKIPGLRNMKNITVHVDSADDTDRDLISAISINGMDQTNATAEYYKRGVTLFDRVNTSLYSKRILESLGLTAVLRVSPLHCHSAEDIEKFLKITADIAQEFV